MKVESTGSQGSRQEVPVVFFLSEPCLHFCIPFMAHKPVLFGTERMDWTNTMARVGMNMMP